MKKNLIFFTLCIFLSGCGLSLSNGGKNITLLTPDIVLSLPGKPTDKCTIIKTVTTEIGSSPCPDSEDAEIKLRNIAGESGGNVAILTKVTKYNDRENCCERVSGIVMHCNSEILNKIGVK